MIITPRLLIYILSLMLKTGRENTVCNCLWQITTMKRVLAGIPKNSR